MNAQTDYCFSQQLQNSLLQDSSYYGEYLEMEEDTRHRMEDILAAKRAGNPIAEDPLVIPVVVHIVHATNDATPGTGSNISDAQVYAALNHLNMAYANMVFNQTSVNTNISFCLSTKDSQGAPSSGINRIPSDQFTDLLINTHDVPGVPGPNSMKAVTAPASQWSRFDYLNIWVVREICEYSGVNCGIVGYAYFPNSHGEWWDGLVIEAGFFGVSQTSDRVAVHEVAIILTCSTLLKVDAPTITASLTATAFAIRLPKTRSLSVELVIPVAPT